MSVEGTGHIVVVRPQESFPPDKGPEVVTAGVRNFKSASMKFAVGDHPLAWPNKSNFLSTIRLSNRADRAAMYPITSYACRARIDPLARRSLRRLPLAWRYRTSGLGMGKLLARLARSFSRKFVPRRLVAICFVVRGGNWNSATLAILNEHLAIRHQIQALRHTVPPVLAHAVIPRAARAICIVSRPNLLVPFTSPAS